MERIEIIKKKIYELEQEIDSHRRSNYPKDFPVREKKAYLKGLKEAIFFDNYVRKLKQDIKKLESENENLRKLNNGN